MDLLAAFFFSSTILNILRMRREQKTKETYLQIAFQASLIGVFLLAAIYVGFSYLAAFHGATLARISHTFSDSSHTLHDDLAVQMGEAVLLEHCPHPSEQQSQSAERRSVQKKCEKSGLIVLTFLNITHRMKNIQPIKTPVFAAFGLSALLYFVNF
jgi:hypothetical protein